MPLWRKRGGWPTEALLITERSGYVLQGADVHLFLAGLDLAAGDKASALAHARQARALATCDGPPDYTYKVAYDEAGALLAGVRGQGPGARVGVRGGGEGNVR